MIPGIATLTAASAIPCRTLATAEIVKKNCASLENDARPKVRVATDIISIPYTTQFFLPIFSIYEPITGAANKKERG